MEKASKNEPVTSGSKPVGFRKKIRISTLDTQGDILLEHARFLSPAERLALMTRLNAMVFNIDEAKNHSIIGKKVVFSRYEYEASISY